jgi:hypothetical protein
MGLSTKMGMLGIAPSRQNFSKNQSIVCVRPIANDGMISRLLRETHCRTISSNCGSIWSIGPWVVLP